MRHASLHPRTRGVFVNWQVMELCRGGELFERIQQQQQFDEKSAAVLVRGVGEVRRLQRRPTDIHPHHRRAWMSADQDSASRRGPLPHPQHRTP